MTKSVPKKSKNSIKKTDTESHILLELGLKRQGLYYASLKIANITQIAQGA